MKDLILINMHIVILRGENMITEVLLKETMNDIGKCEKAQSSKDGSSKLCDTLIAKYVVIYPEFEKI